jgi:hypothetical protein
MDYILLDLERTLSSGVPAYWKGNRYGYTYKIEYAGIFPEGAAKEITKNDRDGKTVAIPIALVQKILAKELKQHEG